MGSFSEEAECKSQAAAADAQPRDARRHANHSRQRETGFAKFTHKMRSKKADRQFDRTVGRADAAKAQPEAGSRAALYEMKMGKEHRRSAQMQERDASGKRSFGFGNPLSFLVGSPVGRRAFFGILLAGICCFMLYDPIANLYNEHRSLQQLEAQYEVTSAEYEQAKADVEYLSTDEGLADYAHEQLGWLRSGEHAVKVKGLSDEAQESSSSADTTTNLALSSTVVETPSTWYSGVFDVIFGYQG